MTDKQAKFSALFNHAYGQQYTVSDVDLAKFDQVLASGLLKGTDLAKELPVAMKVLKTVTWVSVLHSLSDHKITPKGAVGYGFKPDPHIAPVHHADKGRPDLAADTVLETLKKANFSDEEIEKALQPRSMKTAQSVIKLANGSALTGWELVEQQMAHQISEGLTTATAHRESINKTSIDLSWDHYLSWKKDHVGKEATDGVKLIRANWAFREWAAGGFQE